MLFKLSGHICMEKNYIPIYGVTVKRGVPAPFLHLHITVINIVLLFWLQRLAPYGITVGELTGDHQMNREQIEATQVHIIIAMYLWIVYNLYCCMETI